MRKTMESMFTGVRSFFLLMLAMTVLSGTAAAQAPNIASVTASADTLVAGATSASYTINAATSGAEQWATDELIEIEFEFAGALLNSATVSAVTDAAGIPVSVTATLSGSVFSVTRASGESAGPYAFLITGVTNPQTVGSYVISVTGTAGDHTTVTITHAPLDNFVFGAIGNQVAGDPFVINVTAEDEFNNVVTSFGTGVTLSVNQNAIAAGGTTGNFTAGVLSAHSVTINVADVGYTLTATDGVSGATGISAAFNVAHATEAGFDVAAIPNQVAGVVFDVSPLISNLADAFSNPVTGTLVVSVTSDIEGAGNVVVFTDSVYFKGGVPAATGVIDVTLETAGSHTLTIAIGNAVETAAVTVAPASEATVVVANIPGIQTAGVQFNIQNRITGLQDAFNNTVADGIYNVTVTSNLPGDGTVLSNHPVTITSGAAASIVPVTLTVADFHTLTVEVGVASDTASVQVQAGPEAQVTVNNPAAQVAGVQFDISSLIINLQDAFNNTVADGNYNVTVTSASDGVVHPSAAVSFVGGNADGAVEITLTTAGVQGLSVDVGNATDTATVTVNPGPEASVAVADIPGVVTSGVAVDISSLVTDLRDAYNNTVADGIYNVTVTSDVDGNVFGPTLVAFEAGSATGPVDIVFTLTTAGAQILNVSVGAVADIANATVVPGPPASIVLTAPTMVEVGVASTNFEIELRDAGNNVAEALTSMQFAISSNSAGVVTYSPNTPTITAGNTSTTFTYTDSVIGNKTITATWSSGGANVGADSDTIIVFGPPAIDIVSVTPMSVDEGVASTIVVLASDVNAVTATITDISGVSAIGDLVLLASDAPAAIRYATFTLTADFDEGSPAGVLATPEFTATNWFGLTAQDVAGVTIVDVPPTIVAAPVAGVTVTEGDSAQIVVTATDSDEIASITAVSGVAGALTLDASGPAAAVVSATYTFAPTYGDAGISSVTFTATNSNGGTDVVVVPVTVNVATWTLTVLSDGDGAGTVVPGSAIFSHGDEVVISATADLGSEVQAWTLNAAGAIQAGSLVPSANLSSATFTGGLGDATATVTFKEVPFAQQLVLEDDNEETVIGEAVDYTISLEDQFGDPIAAASVINVTLTPTLVGPDSGLPYIVSWGGAAVPQPLLGSSIANVTIAAGSETVDFTWAISKAGTYAITADDGLLPATVTVDVAPVMTAVIDEIFTTSVNPSLTFTLQGDVFKPLGILALGQFDIDSASAGLTAASFVRSGSQEVTINFTGTPVLGETITVSSNNATVSGVASTEAEVDVVILPMPILDNNWPDDGATGVGVNTWIYARYNVAIAPGPNFGNVALLANGIPVEATPNTDSVWLVISGVSAPVLTLERGVEYTVEIPVGAVVNNDGVANATATEWTFTTLMPAPENMVTWNPVSPAEIEDVTITASFTHPITALDLSGITVSASPSAPVVIKSSEVVNNDTIQIVMNQLLAINTIYSVTVPASAVATAVDAIANATMTHSFETAEQPFITKAELKPGNEIVITFSVPVVEFAVNNKAAIESKFAFETEAGVARNPGKALSGTWSAGGTVLTIKVTDAADRNLLPDHYVKIVDASAITDKSGGFLADTTRVQLEGGWVDAPTLASVVARTNNRLEITFSAPTNQMFGPTLSPAELLQILDVAAPIGTTFSGLWSTPSQIVIAVDAPEGKDRTAGLLKPDDVVGIRKDARLRSANNQSKEISNSVKVTGGWVGAPAISSALAATNNTLRVRFNQVTNATGGAGVLSKAVVDRILDFSPKKIGEEYTGLWTNGNQDLLVTVTKTDGRNIIVGNGVRVRASANVRNVTGTSQSASNSVGMTGGWVDGPIIVNAIAEGNNTLTVTFDGNTDQQILAPNPDRDRLNKMFRFERPGVAGDRNLGAGFSGTWVTQNVLVITVSDPTNRNVIPAGNLAPGDKIHLRGAEDGAVRNSSRTSAPGLGNVTLLGTWRAPIMTNAITTNNGEQVLVRFSEQITPDPLALTGAALATRFSAPGVSFGNAVIVDGHSVLLTVSGTVIPPEMGNFTLTYTASGDPVRRLKGSESGMLAQSPNTVTVVNASVPRLVVRLPGQTFTNGEGLSGTPTTRTSAIAFNVEVILTDNTGKTRLNNTVAANRIRISRLPGTGTVETQPNDDGGRDLAVGSSSVTIPVRFDQVQSGVRLLARADGAAGLAQNTEGFSDPVSVQNPRLLIQLPGQTFTAGEGVKGDVPAHITAGIPFGVTVTLVDVNTQPIVNTQDGVTVAITKAAGEGAVSGGAVTLPKDKSSVFVPGLVWSQAAKGVQLKASSSGPGVAGGREGVSNTFDVGAITYVVQLPGQTFKSGEGVSGSVSTNLTAGVPFSVTATLVDAGLRPLKNNSSTVISLDVASGSGTISAPQRTLNPDETRVVFTNVIYSMKDEGVSLKATGVAGGGLGLNKTGTSSKFNVGGGTLLVKLDGQTFTPGEGISGTPKTQKAGVPFPVTVILVNNLIQPQMNTASDVITLVTAEGAGTVVAGTKALSATQVVFDAVTYSKADEGVVLKAISTSGTGLAQNLEGLSSSFDVTTGLLAKIEVTGPPVVIAGEFSEPFTITALDVNGDITTVSQNTAFGLSSTSEGIVTYNPNAPVILKDQSTATFTVNDSAVGDKLLTITGPGVAPVEVAVAVVLTVDPEVNIVSVQSVIPGGFVDVVGPVQEGAVIRVVAEALGTVGGVTPEIDVTEVVASLLPEGVAASEFVTLVTELIYAYNPNALEFFFLSGGLRPLVEIPNQTNTVSPATAAAVRSITAIIEVAEGFVDSEFAGEMSVVVTATNAADRTASDAVALSFYKEDEPPVTEDSGIDELIFASGFGGDTRVHTRNVDPAEGAITAILNSWRGIPVAWHDVIGGGLDRGVYISTGDIDGNGQIDVMHTYGPITDEAVFPNMFHARDGKNQTQVTGRPFQVFPTDSGTAIDYAYGEMRTAIGDFLGIGKPQIAVAQGTASDGWVRLLIHDPANELGGLQLGNSDYVIVGQFQGLADETRNVDGAAFTNNADGGITVAAGDLTGDGRAELIVGQTNSDTSTGIIQVISFPATAGVGIVQDDDLDRFQFNGAFTAAQAGNGGVNVAVGDINGNGVNEVIVTSMGNSRDHGDTRDAAPYNVVSILKPVVADDLVTGFTPLRYGLGLMSVNPSGALSAAAGEFDGNLENGHELVIGSGAIFDYDVDSLAVTSILPAPENAYWVIKANTNADGTAITSITNVLQTLGGLPPNMLPRKAFRATGTAVEPTSGAINVGAGNTFMTDLD